MMTAFTNTSIDFHYSFFLIIPWYISAPRKPKPKDWYPKTSTSSFRVISKGQKRRERPQSLTINSPQRQRLFQNSKLAHNSTFRLVNSKRVGAACHWSLRLRGLGLNPSWAVIGFRGSSLRKVVVVSPWTPPSKPRLAVLPRPEGERDLSM